MGGSARLRGPRYVSDSFRYSSWHFAAHAWARVAGFNSLWEGGSRNGWDFELPSGLPFFP